MITDTRDTPDARISQIITDGGCNGPTPAKGCRDCNIQAKKPIAFENNRPQRTQFGIGLLPDRASVRSVPSVVRVYERAPKDTRIKSGP